MRSMPNKISNKFKYLLILLILIGCGVFIYRLENKACKINGLEREDAEINANKRLSYFAERYSFKNMKFRDAEKSEHDHSWTFSYIDDAKCEVMVDVDTCGASDISGFSSPCLLSKK